MIETKTRFCRECDVLVRFVVLDSWTESKHRKGKTSRKTTHQGKCGWGHELVAYTGLGSKWSRRRLVALRFRANKDIRHALFGLIFGLNAVASKRTLKMLEEAAEKVRMWLCKIAELGG